MAQTTKRLKTICLSALLLSVCSGCVAFVPLIEPDKSHDQTVVYHGRIPAERHQGNVRKSREATRLEHFVKRLDDPKAVVRTHAVFWLGEMGPTAAAAAPRIAALLVSDESPWVRRASAKALPKIVGSDARPALTSALRDRDRWVAHSAKNALQQINS